MSYMKQWLNRRMMGGAGALVIILLGILAPVSFGLHTSERDTHPVPLVATQQAYAQSSTVAGVTNTIQQENSSLKTLCGSSSIMDLADPDAIACSILLWTAQGLFRVTGYFAITAGGLFDYMLWYTIQSSTYAQSDFIETGWGILRDLANIIFIVGLIIAALSIMLSGVVNIGAGDGKKMLAMIIVSALLVNFSLFFAQVIVDASHILARTFYNKLDEGEIIDQSTTSSIEAKKHKELSVSIFGKINPQNLALDVDVIKSESFGWVTVITLYVFISIIHLVFIYIFLSMALLFVGRTVGLMFGMISAPIAFATLGTPLSNTKFVGFHTWLKDLTKNAFMVPVFLFFFYLVILFSGPAFEAIKTSLGNSLTKSLGQKMVDMIIPMSILVGLLMGGKKAASGIASEMASQASSLVGKGVGFIAGSALTVASGGATMATGAIGGVMGKSAGKLLKAGEAYSRSGKMGSKILGGTMSKLGSGVGAASEKVKNANVDVRSSFLGKQAVTALGSAGFGNIGFGQGKYTSAQAESDKRKKESLARAERDAILRNQDEEKKKEEQDEIIVNAQAENDDIMSGDPYLAQQEAQEAKIEDQKEDIKAAREELKSLKEAYAQAVTDHGQTSTEAKNALGGVQDKESAIKDLEAGEKKLTSDLDSGAFYKGSDRIEQNGNSEKDNFKDADDAINSAEKDLREYRAREKEIVSLLGLGRNITVAQSQRLQTLQNTTTPNDEARLRGEVEAKKEAMKTLAESGNSAAKLKINREKIKDAESEQQKIDKQMNLNNRRAIKQELDLMNNAFHNISSTLLAGLPGAVIAGVTAGIGGAPIGALIGAGIYGGGAYAGLNSLNKSAHGFNEQDRKQLRDLFRKTTKKEDK